MSDFVKKNGKNIFTCLTVSSLVVSGTFALVNSDLMTSVFNPDKYSDIVNDNDYDTSTYGIPGENDDSYKDNTQDENAADKANQNSQENQNGPDIQNKLDGVVNTSGTTTVIGGVVGDGSIGNNGNVPSSNNPIHLPNSGDNGSTDGNPGGGGGNSEITDPDYNPNPDTITIAKNPEADGTNTDRYTYYTYRTFTIAMKSIPEYYAGEEITIQDLKNYMSLAVAVLYNGGTKETEEFDILNKQLNAGESLLFTDSAGNELSDTINASTTEGTYNLAIIYKRTGTATNSTPPAGITTYKSYSYGVTVNNYNNSETTALKTRDLTNKKTYSLASYYDETMAELKKDASFINADGTLKQTFLGWYRSNTTNVDKNTASISQCDLGEVGQVILRSAGCEAVDQGYIVKLIEGKQTLVGYTGDAKTLVVPNGVTDIDIEAQYKNNNVEKIQLSPSVETINHDSINSAYANLSQYSLTNTSNHFSVDGGILYNGAGTKLVNIPSNYWDSHDSFTLNNNVAEIGKDSFSHTEATKVNLIINQESSAIEGLTYLPEGATIRVNDSSDDLTYLRYVCALKDKVNIVVEGKNLKDKYKYQAGCMFDDKTLVYISSFEGGLYTLPSETQTIASTAFVDINQNVNSLVIPTSVRKIENEAFAKMVNLRTIIVDGAIDVTLGTKLFNDSDVISPTLTIYLKGITEDSFQYQQWFDGIKNVISENTAEHLICSANGIYINEIDGAIYTVDKNNQYTLVSMPQNVTTFELPQGKNVVAIGDNALVGCDKLKIIILPDTITSIGKNVFDGCDKLEVLFVPEVIEEICLSEASALPNIKLIACNKDALQDENNQNIYYSSDKKTLLAVVSDYNQEVLTLDKATIDIGSKALKGCTKVTQVIVPSGSLKNIGAEAFKNCKALTGLPVDDENNFIQQYQSIGNEAFYGCKSLSSVVLNGDDLNLGDSAFEANGIINLTLTGSFKTIGKRVFANNELLATVNFGVDNQSWLLKQKSLENNPLFAKTTLATGKDTFETTGEETFMGCLQLNTVSFNGAIKAIGDHCFDGCNQLKNMIDSDNFNNSIETIGNYAFNGCEDIDFNGYFQLFTNLKTIGDYAFYNCINVHFCYIGNLVETIGESAFENNTGKNSLMLRIAIADNHSLKSIGKNAFKNNTSLISIDLRDDNTKIGIELNESCFENCTALENVYWGNNTLALIGENCFAGCLALKDIQINTQIYLTVIKASAFAGCSQISVADFSRVTQLTTISENVFGNYQKESQIYQCDSLMKIILPEKVTLIESAAFIGAINLTSVTILNSQEAITIAADAFNKEEENATLATLLISVPSSKDNSLYEKYKEAWKEALTIGENYYDDIITTSFDGITTYYNGGLYTIKDDGTYKLMSMDSSKIYGAVLLKQTSEIGDGAFKNCAAMTEVDIPENVTKIGKAVFEGCTSLEAIVFENEDAPTISGSLFGPTTPNENIRIYIIAGTAAKYYAIDALKDYKLYCTGDSYWTDITTGAIYACYNSTSSASINGHLYQLMYVPKSYANSFSAMPYTAYIYEEAFRNSQITGFRISTDYLVSVGDYTFANCQQLTNVDLGSYFNSSRLDHLGKGAFENCIALSSWKISSSSTGYSTTIQIDGVSTMGTGVFKGCTAIAAVKWTSKNLSDIPASTFENCTSLTQLSFVTSLTTEGYPIRSFGDRCFAGCTNFTSTAGSLASFSGLTSIGEECYDGCSNMSLLIFPSSLKTIGKNALRDCDALSVIAMSLPTPISLKDVGIKSEVWAKMNTYVPEGLKQTYLQSWADEELDAPGSLIDSSKAYRSISGNIYGCEDPTWTYYGATSGGVYHSGLIFAGAPSILANGQVKIYGSTSYRVTGIAQGAFEGNHDIVSFVGNFAKVANGVTTQYCFMSEIGNNAFKNCDQLTAIKLTATSSAVSSKTLVIGDSAFEGCSSLANFTLTPNVISIGNRAFGATKENFVLEATNIITPANVTIGNKIFGDSLVNGLKIKVESRNHAAAFIDAWGEQLKTDYNLTNQQLNDLFAYETYETEARKLSQATVATNLPKTPSNKDEDEIQEGEN